MMMAQGRHEVVPASPPESKGDVTMTPRPATHLTLIHAAPPPARRVVTRIAAGIALTLVPVLAACQDSPTAPSAPTAGHLTLELPLDTPGVGLVRVAFPEQDPGGPFYARVSPYPEFLNQVFTDGRTVAIPIYRDPSCIPGDFNLFQAFDFPSEAGPGAFGCPLLVSGTFLIEPGAPLGTFPVQVNTRGPAQIWFVDHDEFVTRTSDGILPMARLAEEFTSLRIGTADHFMELLRPRLDARHQVVITSHGSLADGGRFRLSVNHMNNELRSISIRLNSRTLTDEQK